MKPKQKKPRRTLWDLCRQVRARRIQAFIAWRIALSRFWRIDLLWNAIKFRWQQIKFERGARRLIENKMSPDWRDSRPKKLQRQLGVLPPL